MCETIFTFGQRGSHFAQCPSTREFTSLPNKLTSLLSSSQVQQIHHVTLGFEDSFLVTWQDKSGQDRIDSQDLPVELRDFLYARNAQQKLVRDIRNIRCTLGPYNCSFFVHDGSAYCWMDLPTDLLSALQSRIKNGDWIDRPRSVALGADGNFVLITEMHAAVWSLRNYNTISDLLHYSYAKESGISEILTIVLHAYRFGSFITMSRSGTLIYENMPPQVLPGVEAMVAPILQDTKEAELKPLIRRESDKRGSVQRRPSNLQQRAQLRRDWSEHSQQFTAQTKGVKLSLRLSVTTGGLARLLG